MRNTLLDALPSSRNAVLDAATGPVVNQPYGNMLTPLDGEFDKALRRAAAGTVSALQSFGGMVQDMHDPAAAQQTFQRARERVQQVAAANPAAVGHLKDVRGLGDAILYAQSGLGEAVPSAVTALGGGLAGRAVASRLAPNFARKPMAAELAGGALGLFPQEAGNIALTLASDPTAVQNTTPTGRFALSTLGGGIGSVLEAAVPAWTASKLIGPAAKRASTQQAIAESGALGHIGKTAFVGGVAEGATEGAQHVTSGLAHYIANPEKTIEPWDVADAFAKGVLPGTALGGLGGVGDVVHSKLDAIRATRPGEVLGEVGSFAGKTAAKVSAALQDRLDARTDPTSDEDYHFFTRPNDIDTTGRSDADLMSVLSADDTARQNAAVRFAKKTTQRASQSDSVSDAELKAAVDYLAAIQNGRGSAVLTKTYGDTLAAIYRRGEAKSTILDAASDLFGGTARRGNAMTPASSEDKRTQLIDQIMQLWHADLARSSAVFADADANDPQVAVARRAIGQWIANGFADEKGGKKFLPKRFVEALGDDAAPVFLSAFKLLQAQGLTDVTETEALKMARAIEARQTANRGTLSFLLENLSPLARQEFGGREQTVKRTRQLLSALRQLRQGEVKMTPEADAMLTDYFGANKQRVLRAFRTPVEAAATELKLDGAGVQAGVQLEDEANLDAEVQAATDYETGLNADWLPDSKVVYHGFGVDGKALDTSFAGARVDILKRRNEIAGAYPKSYVRVIGVHDRLREELSGDREALRQAEDKLLADSGFRISKYDVIGRAEALARINRRFRLIREEVYDDKDALDVGNITAFRESTGRADEFGTVEYGRIYLEQEHTDAETGEITTKPFVTSAAKLIKHANKSVESANEGAAQMHEKLMAGLSSLLTAEGGKFTGRVGVKDKAGGDIRWLKQGEYLPDNFAFFSKDGATVATFKEQQREQQQEPPLTNAQKTEYIRATAKYIWHYDADKASALFDLTSSKLNSRKIDRAMVVLDIPSASLNSVFEVAKALRKEAKLAYEQGYDGPDDTDPLREPEKIKRDDVVSSEVETGGNRPIRRDAHGYAATETPLRGRLATGDKRITVVTLKPVKSARREVPATPSTNEWRASAEQLKWVVARLDKGLPAFNEVVKKLTDEQLTGVKNTLHELRTMDDAIARVREIRTPTQTNTWSKIKFRAGQVLNALRTGKELGKDPSTLDSSPAELGAARRLLDKGAFAFEDHIKTLDSATAEKLYNTFSDLKILYAAEQSEATPEFGDRIQRALDMLRAPRDESPTAKQPVEFTNLLTPNEPHTSIEQMQRLVKTLDKSVQDFLKVAGNFTHEQIEDADKALSELLGAHAYDWRFEGLWPDNTLSTIKARADQALVSLFSDSPIGKDPQLLSTMSAVERGLFNFLIRGRAGLKAIQVFATRRDSNKVAKHRDALIKLNKLHEAGKLATKPAFGSQLRSALRIAEDRIRELATPSSTKGEKVPGSEAAPHSVPMSYTMKPDELRAELQSRYPNGATTAQLIRDGVRTATTRKPPQGVLPNHYITFPGVTGLFRVIRFESIDLKTEAGKKRWSMREGWDADVAMRKFPSQVYDGATQMIFERVASAPNAQSTAAPAPPTAEQKQAIIDEIKTTLGESVKVEFAHFIEGTDGSEWSGDWTDKLIRISVSAMDHAGVGRHESVHQLFNWLRQHGAENVKQVIENAAMNPTIQRQLKRLLSDHKNAIAQLADPEEAAAYLYQFWKAGLVTLGPKTESMFGKIAGALSRMWQSLSAYVLGNADAKTAIADREALARADVLLQYFAEGKFADGDRAVLQVLNAQLGDQLKQAASKGFLARAMQHDALRNAVYTSSDVLRDTGNPYFIDIADAFATAVGRKRGKQPLLEATAQVRSQKLNRLNDILFGKDPEDLKLALKYLQSRTDARNIHDPVVRKIVEDIRSFLFDMHHYMIERGVKRYDEKSNSWKPIPAIARNYFPVVWNIDKITSNPSAFVERLLSVHSLELEKIAAEADAEVATGKDAGVLSASATVRNRPITTEDVANAITMRIIESSGAVDVSESTSSIGITPFARHVNRRTLWWIDHERFTDFMSDDLTHIVTSYTVQTVKRGEYVSRFGNDGERLQDLVTRAYALELLGASGVAKAEKELAKMVADWQAHPKGELDQGRPTLRQAAESLLPVEESEARILEALEKIKLPIRAIMAQEGTLGRNINPTLRNVSAGIMVYQSWRVLLLTLFSSFTDPLGMLMRGGTLNDAWRGFARGVREIAAQVRDERLDDGAARLARMLGTVDAGSYLDSLGQTYSSLFMYGKMHRLNNALFRWNGMEAWNRGMRIQATVAAKGFIERHLTKPTEHSERYLKDELGLDPARKDRFMKDGELDFTNSAVRAAVMRWVDGAILRPDASQRPIVASDPHYALFYQLKQFTYSFHKTILTRAVLEAKHGNYIPTTALFAVYIPVAIAAGAAKELLVPGEEPAWMKGGLGEYISYGFMRANLLGVPQLGLEAFYNPFADATRSVEQAAGLFGPAVNQATGLLLTPLTEVNTIGSEALNALPGAVVANRMAR